MKKIGIVLNQYSGLINGVEELKNICDRFSEKCNFQIRETSDNKSCDDLTLELIEEKCDVIVGAGGDGTLNTVAKHLIDTNIYFGILPVGTLNHFARDLKIPLVIEEAIKLIVGQPDLIKIDVGVCNGLIFLNNSGLGIYPEIVKIREKSEKKGYFKWFAYFIAVFEVIKSIPMVDIKIKMNEETIYKTTPFVFVGNNIYELGGFSTGSRDSLSDGLLTVWISRRTSFWGLAGLFMHAIFANVKEHIDFDALEAKQLMVEMKRKIINVSFDGEVKKIESPLAYKIKPKCLNVIVPLQEISK